jgi:hypothetical protein
MVVGVKRRECDDVSHSKPKYRTVFSDHGLLDLQVTLLERRSWLSRGNEFSEQESPDRAHGPGESLQL